MNKIETQTLACLKARNSIPKELRPIFDRMVAEYKFQALLHHGRGYVSYKVIEALVKDGWRPK